MIQSTNPSRTSPFRILGWIAVGSMLALAMLGPTAGGALAALSGAVYTSNIDGSTIDQNSYALKSDVYLTGGPCNGGSHLAAGDYYFEVVQPAGGGALLSTDPIGNREFTIAANGFISSTTGTHLTHAVTCDPAVTGITIQLIPFDDASNGEYKLQVASASTVEACAGFNKDLVFAICQQADQKSDNFKVGPVTTTTSSSSTTVSSSSIVSSSIVSSSIVSSSVQSSSSVHSSSVASSSVQQASSSVATTQGGGVAGATGKPVKTPPVTSTLGDATPASDSNGFRIVLLGFAILLASVLLLQPRSARNRE